MTASRYPRRLLLVGSGAAVLATVGGVAAASTSGPVTSLPAEGVGPERFGAVGDGVADDTRAVQQTCDAVVDGKWRRAVLTGRYRLTASVRLGDGSAVHLDRGAELLRDFSAGGEKGGTLVNADPERGNRGISVTGPGWIRSVGDHARGKHVSLTRVENVDLRDFSVGQVFGDWSVTLKNCKAVRVHRICCTGGQSELYTDGLHLYGGSDIAVSECVFDSGDDAISLTVESPDNDWIEDVTITNCVLRSAKASGVKMHANAPAVVGIRRVRVLNCVVRHAVGVGVWLRDDIGGAVSDISMSGLAVDSSSASNTSVRLDGLSRTSIDDVTVVEPNGYGVVVDGGRQVAFDGLVVRGQRAPNMSDVRVDASADVTFRGGRLDGATSHAVLLGSAVPVDGVRLAGMEITNCDGTAVRLIRARRSQISGCRFVACESAFVEDEPGANAVVDSFFVDLPHAPGFGARSDIRVERNHVDGPG